MNVKIITDSTTDIPANLREKITVVPLTIFFGEEAYLDGVTLSHQEFYQKMASSEIMPNTSQPTPDAFTKVFAETVSAGNEAVVITLSPKLSGTYQSACIAAMDFPGSVFVVDSTSAAAGSGILVELAVSMAESGLSASEIAHRLEQEKDNIYMLSMVENLDYLKHGGRIAKDASVSGGMLAVKPILLVKDGAISILGKARGVKQASAMLMDQIETIGVDLSKPFLLGYTGFDDTLMNKFAESSQHIWNQAPEKIPSTILGSVVGAHFGPGTVAAAFFKKN